MSPGARNSSAEVVRSEVARGRMIIPGQHQSHSLEPMCIGVASTCKINANIGNSATTSNIEEELDKLHYSVQVRRRHRHGSFHRRRYSAHPRRPSSMRRRFPIGTVPIYEALAASAAWRI